MKTVLSIRSNELYKKNGDVFEKHHEFIMLLVAPKYHLSNDMSVVREQSLEEVRFNISNDEIGNLIKILEDLKSES